MKHLIGVAVAGAAEQGQKSDRKPCEEQREGEREAYVQGRIRPEMSRNYHAKFTQCVPADQSSRNVIRLVGDGRVFDLPPGFSERLKAVLAGKLGS